MIRYQGESIDFSIEIDKERWSDYTKVVAYLYTHTSRIAKFLYENTSTTSVAAEIDADAQADSTDIAEVAIQSTKAQADSSYLKLSIQYDRFLQGTIPAEYTKTMEGALLLDVIGYKSDKSYHIKARTTGIQINYTPIKQEV